MNLAISKNFEAEKISSALETISSDYDDSFFNKRDWINLNGVATKAIGIRGMYQGEGDSCDGHRLYSWCLW
jgi:hypothetical protein